MTRLKGKVKSKQITDVSEGTWVMWKSMIGIHIGIVVRHRIDSNGKETANVVIRYIKDGQDNGTVTIELWTLQTLIIEHDGKQYPLKYSQWQAAINNEELDSDKEVVFEVLHSTFGRSKEEMLLNAKQIAKIIPQHETYTEEQWFQHMQYYMEYCQKNPYVTPMVWLKEYKHY